jgi:hypothetical protein
VNPYPPLEIEVAGRPEAGDLADCLSRHGFPASLLEQAGQWRVEVRCPSEAPRDLLLDLRAPLRLWAREHSCAGLRVRAGDDRFTVSGLNPDEDPS